MRLAHLSILALASTAALVSACSSSDTAVPTQPTAVKCQVSLAASTPVIAAQGGPSSLTVTTSPECPWDASTKTDWLSGLSPASGQGPGKVEFNVAANPLTSARDGEIVVNGSPLRLSQQASPCNFDFRPDNLTVNSDGGSVELQVSTTAGCAWTAVANAAWLTINGSASGSGNGTVSLTVAANAGGARSSTLTVAGKTVNVNQGALGCSYLLNPPSTSVSATGGPGSFTVASATGCTWNATANAAWLTITGGASAPETAPCRSRWRRIPVGLVAER
jgi:hypothetical protein